MTNHGTRVPVVRSKPSINVTPLIDVLLVMLIIFMVAAPLRPERFLAKVPAKPDRDDRLEANINTLVVTINSDLTLKLNGNSEMGSVYDTSKLSETLADVFRQRRLNHDYKYELRDRADLPEDTRIERTV